MSIHEFKSRAAIVHELLKECDSFELRGPKLAGVMRIEGASVEVMAQSKDWSEVVGDRVFVDNRTDNLSDLIPNSRQRLEMLSQGFAERVHAASAKSTPKPKGPGM